MKTCMSDVRGMPAVVKAVEDAVVEQENLLVCGPPGIGKTMVARRIGTIMPPLTDDERLILGAIYHAAQLLDPSETYGKERPFRAPHHTASKAALCGSSKRPGELDLASCGVLFLDELPEFHLLTIRAIGAALHGMRGAPLIIASACPCPCGWSGAPERICLCKEAATLQHRKRIKEMCEPLQIKSWIDLPSISLKDMGKGEPAEASEVIRARVIERMGL